MATRNNEATRIGAESEEHPGEVGLAAVMTMVIWVMCLLVGFVGCLSRHTEAGVATKPAIAESRPIEVELRSATPAMQEPAHEAAEVADAPQIIEPAEVVSMVDVPTPVIAFAVAAQRPARVAPLASAGFLRSATRLTFGEGLAANQPAPEYPREAQLAGQEGEVVIELTVDNEGNVTEAKVAQGSRWPLLNHSALETVRRQWHLTAGHPGIYMLPVTFKMRDDAGGK